MLKETRATGASARARLLVAVIAALLAGALVVLINPGTADAAPFSCQTYYRVWQKSNMTSGSSRLHLWLPPGASSYKDSGWKYGLGWKYTSTGIQSVDDHFYMADGSMPHYSAYCVQAPQ